MTRSTALPLHLAETTNTVLSSFGAPVTHARTQHMNDEVPLTSITVCLDEKAPPHFTSSISYFIIHWHCLSSTTLISSVPYSTTVEMHLSTLFAAVAALSATAHGLFFDLDPFTASDNGQSHSIQFRVCDPNAAVEQGGSESAPCGISW